MNTEHNTPPARDENARDAAALHLWDEGIVRPESQAREVVEFLLREGHMVLSSPPAADVREALAILDGYTFLNDIEAGSLRMFAQDVRRVRDVLRDVLRSEVRPRVSVTDTTGVREIRECTVCGERVTASNATDEWELRHAHTEVRPYGTVTDAEVERAARAIYEDLGGEWPWSSLTSSFQESYLSNARAALEAAREARS